MDECTDLRDFHQDFHRLPSFLITEILSALPLGSRTTSSPPSGEETFPGAIFVHLRVSPQDVNALKTITAAGNFGPCRYVLLMLPCITGGCGPQICRSLFKSFQIYQVRLGRGSTICKGSTSHPGNSGMILRQPIAQISAPRERLQEKDTVVQ